MKMKKKINPKAFDFWARFLKGIFDLWNDVKSDTGYSPLDKSKVEVQDLSKDQK